MMAAQGGWGGVILIAAGRGSTSPVGALVFGLVMLLAGALSVAFIRSSQSAERGRYPFLNPGLQSTVAWLFLSAGLIVSITAVIRLLR